MGGRLLGREPVMTVSTIVALLIAVLPAFGWSTNTVGAVSAALVAAGGALEASLVSVDRLLPLLVGLGKAVLAAVASFGVHLPDNHVAAFMAVLTVVAGLQVRKQVGAVQPPMNRRGREVDGNGWEVGVLDAEARDTADSPSLDGTDTPGMRPESGAHAHTEVFGAVVSDGPLPGDHGAEDEQENQPRHGRPYGGIGGTLPGFGT